MTVGLFIEKAIAKLKDSSTPTARLDAEVIVAHDLDVDRSWLQAHSEDELPKNKEVELLKKIERRTKNEPVAYILGHKEFYGRDFIVNNSVLVPRPESETMIDLLNLHFPSLEKVGPLTDEGITVVDVGTGSGNLIITATLEMSKVEGRRLKVSNIGLDISDEALKVARKNAKNLKAKVEFKHFDLLKDNLSSILNPKYSIFILANLPYVPNDCLINEPAMLEPKIALFSGDDGLYHYRKMFEQLSKLTDYNIQITVLTEALPFQHDVIEIIAKNTGFKLIESKDLIQVFYRPLTF